MRKAFLFLSVTVFLMQLCAAQGKWNLPKCVSYATQHNISVRQADVQARVNKLAFEQSKLALYPSVNSQHSTGYQFGRSIDPASNQFTTNEILFANHSLNLNADLFNWFRKRNTVAANEFIYKAGMAQLEKARNDISLNVVNAYLATLLTGEQIHVAVVQVGQSKEQRDNISKRVNVGALPEENLAEMETQLANDSVTLIAAKANYQLNLLQLQALLNLDAATVFDIDTPPVDSIPVESLAELEPDKVFESAIINLPQQKIDELNIKAATKNVMVAKAAMYPSLRATGGLDTRYSNVQKYLYKNYRSVVVPIGEVAINGINYIVNGAQNIPTGEDRNTYFRQLGNNFSQNVGLTLSLPIFNGGVARSNWKQAKLTVESQQLILDQDRQNLKQAIYQVHTNALAAIKKYNTQKIVLAAAQRAYDLTRKRFDVGALNPIDLITNQNNLFKAKINLLAAKYDYVFKLKMLEFYTGNGIKL